MQEHLAKTAFISEVLEQRPASVELQQLLLHSTLSASALVEEMELSTTDRLAIYMPNHPEVCVCQCKAAQSCSTLSPSGCMLALS